KVDSWKRLMPDEAVFTSDPLVSLPGYASQVRLNNGMRLLLRGNLPEFSLHPLMDYLMDSAVILHQNSELELDMTLQRGRVFVENTKGTPAKVRIRFNDTALNGAEVWDLTLEPNTEVGFDLLKHY